MKLDPRLIARTSLGLLNEVGLEGLTMRVVAKELDVRAPALYWHIKGKQELLDEMAEIMFVEAVDGLESPARGETWQDWLLDTARRLRGGMLKYRDGARVFAGTNITHQSMYRTTELTMRTLRDAGFQPFEAARAFRALHHFVIGFTIEEQARIGITYTEGNPYESPLTIDPVRFPLSAAALDELWTEDTDGAFTHGVQLIIDGMAAQLERGAESA
ncbi:putative transcriptional regulator, TetR family [Actinorhabdospora filicis]|uniref:Transcriptional regulator, TetR family n=1 Tax=Actinorhabdospora filicis TaxID=1785913 RepID=A0A9W6SQR4_9ACTN|nr:TetR/AcrR family transcriptional regulator C-terminal domain-containing protein [Actinorhabdospora filicis]GLZ80274.1 putative transcriptional regulator, TetR family [Actinorhabdospora filicis]